MAERRRPAAGWGWTTGVGLLALLAGLPLLAIFWLAASPTQELWAHLFATALPHYLQSTLLLGAGVGLGVLAIGVPLAWMVSAYDFPGRRLLDWALFLPLAMPTYLIAFVYTDFLDYAGPVQTALRTWFGWRSGADYAFPQVRTLSGGAIILSLCLYPYVYWLARAAFLGRGARLIEAARLMGAGPVATFWRVGLPLARPALAAGVLIAWMETVNDIGAVQHFGIQTLTVGIFDVWQHLGRPGAAAQIALVLLALVLLLAAIERAARGGRRYHSDNPAGTVERRQLGQTAGWTVAVLLALPLAAGFLVPCGRLLYYAIRQADETVLAQFWQLAWHSVSLAAMAAAVAAAAALLLAYGARLNPSRGLRQAVRFATLGYAIPGAVLALGVLTLTTTADLRMADLTEWLGGTPRAILGHGDRAGVCAVGAVCGAGARHHRRRSATGDAQHGRGGADAGVEPGIDPAARTPATAEGQLDRRRGAGIRRFDERVADDPAAAPLQLRDAGNPCLSVGERRTARSLRPRSARHCRGGVGAGAAAQPARQSALG
jgi:iron(III) transport system permease protein